MTPPSSEQYKYDAFISHSHKDVAWVRDWLLPRLEGAGLKVCIDYRDFDLGVAAAINMRNAVNQSRKTILILTPNWVASEWSNFEFLLIHSKNPTGTRQRMLPLMLEDCELPDELGILTYAEFRDAAGRDAQFDRVLRTFGIETANGTATPILQPDFAHPYPLQANFTGRVAERNALTTWYTEQRQPVYALVAIGGMGKSALTWVWVRQEVLGDTLVKDKACTIDATARPEGVLWWSFYERESRFEAFLERAIAYASAGRIDPRALPSPRDKVEVLLRLLLDRNILLVLDGIERELRAYASLNAAYQGDAVQEDAEGVYRTCVDPHLALFLENAASLPLRGRILLTSRLMPRELEGGYGRPLAGCLKQELTRMEPADAVAFFHAEGISGARAEIEAACAPYEYHPLALRLLAGVVVGDLRTPGDIQVAKQHPVTEELRGKAKHHILEVAYNALPDTYQDALSRIAAFRNPMTYDTLAAVLAGEADEDFDTMLRALVNRGLLLFEPAHGGGSSYDLHPIVRQYAYDRLTDKKGVHTRLRDHFSAVPAPEDTRKVERIKDLDPIIELYHHTLRAGQPDEAFELFHDRLHDVLYYRFGAYHTCIELLSALFPNGQPLTSEGRAVLPQIKKESHQAWTLAALANSYSLSGQPRRAVPLFEAQIELREKAGSTKNLAIGLGNMADVQMKLGALADAEANLRRRIELCREIGDEFREAVGHSELGWLLAYRGAFNDALHELATARKALRNQNATQSEGVVEAHSALAALLAGDAEAGLDAARSTLQLWHKKAKETFPNERDRVSVEWLLGWAKTALALDGRDGSDTLLSEAEAHLTDALTRCRRINLVELEPDILLAWARWHRAKGDAPAAHQHAEEALSIADRCEYRLKQADLHNFLAQLALDTGDKTAAHHEATLAKEHAWCDGPPHAYQPALDEAERLLAATQ